MDKFLLAENPMRPDDHGVYIIHLLDPVAIITCMEGMVLMKKDSKDVFKKYQFRNSDGIIEEWTFVIYHLAKTNYGTDPDQGPVKLLDRAWRWYRAYLEWEDKQIDNENPGLAESAPSN